MYAAYVYKPMKLLGKSIDSAAIMADEMTKLIIANKELERQIDSLDGQRRISQQIVEKFRSMYQQNETLRKRLVDVQTATDNFVKDFNTFAKDGTPAGKLEGTKYQQVAEGIYNSMQKLLTRRDVGSKEYVKDFTSVRDSCKKLTDAISEVEKELEQAIKSNDLDKAERLMKDYMGLVSTYDKFREKINSIKLGNLSEDDRRYAEQVLKEKGIDFVSYAKKYAESKKVMEIWLPRAGAIIVVGLGYHYIVKPGADIFEKIYGTIYKIVQKSRSMTRRDFITLRWLRR